MTPDNDPEAFLNAFQRTAEMASWLESQWVAVPIPCLVGTAKQTMDILLASDIADYK